MNYFFKSEFKIDCNYVLWTFELVLAYHCQILKKCKKQ